MNKHLIIKRMASCATLAMMFGGAVAQSTGGSSAAVAVPGENSTGKAKADMNGRANDNGTAAGRAGGATSSSGGSGAGAASAGAGSSGTTSGTGGMSSGGTTGGASATGTTTPGAATGGTTGGASR